MNNDTGKVISIIVLAVVFLGCITLATVDSIYNGKAQITQLEDQLAVKDDCTDLQDTIDTLRTDAAKMRQGVAALTKTTERLALLMLEALEPATE